MAPLDYPAVGSHLLPRPHHEMVTDLEGLDGNRDLLAVTDDTHRLRAHLQQGLQGRSGLGTIPSLNPTTHEDEGDDAD